MTTDELHGRMAALEVIALTSLGLYLANASNDPDLGKARAVLGHLRMMIDGRAAVMPEAAACVARAHGDDLLSIVLENLRLLKAG